MRSEAVHKERRGEGPAAAGAARQALRPELLRQLLATEEERLAERHRQGEDGWDLVTERSRVADRVIGQAAEAAWRGELEAVGADGLDLGGADRVALVALGGYGRGELSPGSDIDLLILYRGASDFAAASRLNEILLYQLWDGGFRVGHSLRSLDDCVKAAREDVVTRHALLDARPIWGAAGLVRTLAQRLDEEVLARDPAGCLEDLKKDREAQYRAAGPVVCLQEPNVKESAGGLRDLHTLCWAIRIVLGSAGEEGIALGSALIRHRLLAGGVRHQDVEEMMRAYTFTLRIRHEMHQQTGRPSDLLTLGVQQQIAESLGYRDTEQQQATELLMRDYYLGARRLHFLTTSYAERLRHRHLKRRWYQRARVAPAMGGFLIRDGLLEWNSAMEEGRLDLSRMMLAFGYAQATGSEIGVTLQESMEAARRQLGEAERTSPEVRESFLRMVATTGRVAGTLRRMHGLDLLGAILPEFGRLTCLVQHDLFHRYTVDEHTLRALEVFDELHASRGKALERYRTLYQQVADPLALHLGMLFHDIGKGLGGGHTEKGVEITRRICDEWAIHEERTEAILFLVREHLVMSQISQRRDLTDEKVIRDFAARVGTVERLSLLTLLTYADVNAVGPGVWNEWKDSLLWELYQRTHAVLAPLEENEQAHQSLIELLVKSLASELSEEEVRGHLALLPREYARFTPAGTIAEHLRLANRQLSQPVRTSWKLDLTTRSTDLHLSTHDRRGLLASVTGALAAHGVSILSLQLNTRADGLVVDSFKVVDAAGEPIVDPSRWQQLDATIQRSLRGEFDVATAVARRLRAQGSTRLRKRHLRQASPPQFGWDQQTSEKSTILEVRAGDRLGLAYRIASTLTGLGLDIVFAKVATEMHLALDIFYVVDAAGGKLPDASLPSIEGVLHEALRDLS
jgi:[protein-PII] uridylyltransferase